MGGEPRLQSIKGERWEAAKRWEPMSYSLTEAKSSNVQPHRRVTTDSSHTLHTLKG